MYVYACTRVRVYVYICVRVHLCTCVSVCAFACGGTRVTHVGTCKYVCLSLFTFNVSGGVAKRLLCKRAVVVNVPLPPSSG